MRVDLGFVTKALFAAAILAGCGGGETGTGSGGSGGQGGAGGSGAGGSGAGGSGGEIVIGGDRPVHMFVSESYDPKTPAPLVMLLHGHGAGGLLQSAYFEFAPVADARGYIYAVPDGLPDANGQRFWNATDACCDFGGIGVDDSSYLSGVIDEIEQRYNVDPKRVFVVGHSNGGYMAYRMACDHADQIAAIVSVAGATFQDDALCNPTEPVAVAHVHGTEDESVLYEGGEKGSALYPGAVESAEKWAGYDGCDATFTEGGTMDLEATVAGEETAIRVYGSGCDPGGRVELWTMQGAPHVISITDAFPGALFDFLEAHPKP